MRSVCAVDLNAHPYGDCIHDWIVPHASAHRCLRAYCSYPHGTESCLGAVSLPLVCLFDESGGWGMHAHLSSRNNIKSSSRLDIGGV